MNEEHRIAVGVSLELIRLGRKVTRPDHSQEEALEFARYAIAQALPLAVAYVNLTGDFNKERKLDAN